MSDDLSWFQPRHMLPKEFIEHHERRTGKTIAYIAGDDGNTASLTFSDDTFETIRLK
jgi:hypothetical protein